MLLASGPTNLQSVHAIDSTSAEETRAKENQSSTFFICLVRSSTSSPLLSGGKLVSLGHPKLTAYDIFRARPHHQAIQHLNNLKNR